MSINGFIPDKQEDHHWWMGSGRATRNFGNTELMSLGHGWKPYLPKKEIQKKGKLETSFCTIFGTANAYETLSKFKGFDLPKNFSERYNGVIAQITPTGGSPHQAGESFRLFGVIADELLPFSDKLKSWEEYASPNPMLEEFITLGQENLRKYRFGHEFIHYQEKDFTPGKIIAGLGRGPVCASVSAWREKDGLYRKFAPDGHWVQVVDYKEGEYWELFDSYEPVLKRYEWDAKFEQAKLYFLDENPSKALPHEIDYLKWLLSTGQWDKVIPWIRKRVGF